MTVEKFIRILGYIVYFALWSPVIAIVMIVGPIVAMVMARSITVGWEMYVLGLKAGFNHDKIFIETGVWY